MRPLNKGLHRNGPLALQVQQPADGQVVQLRTDNRSRHEKLGRKDVCLFFKFIGDDVGMKAQVTQLVGKRPSPAIRRWARVQQSDRMLSNPLRQAIDTSWPEVLLND